jgi:DNA-binding transcriptional MerR regulator
MRNKYDTHVKPFLDRIPAWRKDGLTEEQVAKRLGVAYSTFREYAKKYSALSAVIKKGKEDLLEELKESLYKRAMGYEYEEVKQFIEKDAQDRQKTKVEKIKKFVFSDTCLLFALKNLDPENWRDRKEVQQDINQSIQHLTIDIVDDEDNVIELDDEGLN